MFAPFRPVKKLVQTWLTPRKREPIRRKPCRLRLWLECLETRLAPATVTSVTASTGASTYGQPVLFAASVTADSGTPTGSVEFFDDTTGADLGAGAPGNSGGVTATWTYSTTPRQLQVTPAAHVIRAVYTPTGSFTGSFGILPGGESIAPLPLTVTGIMASDKVYDGTTAAALNTNLTGGDILVVDQPVSGSGRIREFTPAGAVAETFTFATTTTGPRGIVMDARGNIDVFNGTFPSILTTINPATGTLVADTRYPGWGSLNSSGYGGLAAYGDHVFATDAGGGPNGIIDFNIDTFSATHFADGTDYLRITMGRDGLLYGLSPATTQGGYQIDAFDPATHALKHHVVLTVFLNSIAVDQTGNIYGMSGDTNIYQFKADGSLARTVSTGTHGYTNIDVNDQGQIEATIGGTILLTNTSLSHFTTLSVSSPGAIGTFSAWVQQALGGVPIQLQGVLGGDTVTLNTRGAKGTFASKDVGNVIAVTISGLTISGPQAANYALKQPTTAANITPAPLTVTGITANNKIYDGTTSATVDASSATLFGVIGDDTVTLNPSGVTGSFAVRDVGTGITVTVTGLIGGAQAGDYVLTPTSTTANIAPAVLDVSGVTANSKMYDATTSVTLDPADAVLVGVVAGDAVTLGGGTATFASSGVADNIPVTVRGLTLAGPQAGDYAPILDQPQPTANITPAILGVTGIAANDKVYDATAAATLKPGIPALVGVFGVDAVTLNAGVIKGTFASKDAGTNVPVNLTGLSISGPQALNYVLVPTTTANITPFQLTVSGAIMTASDKVYDSTTMATLKPVSATLTGVFAGDTVSVTEGTGTFASKDVGTYIPVTVTGLTLGGAQAGDYRAALSQPQQTAANITPAPLAVAGITANDKLYDGTLAATLNLNNAMLVGVYGGDSVTLDTSGATGTFASKNVANNITVTVTGLSLAGAQAGDYALTPTTTTANIELAAPTAPSALMVKDIHARIGYAPLDLVSLDGTVFFEAADAANGPSIWKSDGTAAGTVVVKKFSVIGALSNIATAVGNVVFFAAVDNTGTTRLWRTDGTDAGTFVLNSNAYVNFDFLNTSQSGVVNNIFYFSAENGTNQASNTELWRSDGTVAGTYMVKEINPATTGQERGSHPSNFTNVNGTLYFTANDGTHGQELWKSDGTASGTVMVKDMNPGPSGSRFVSFANFNGTLIFAASSPTDLTGGWDLWRSDGTSDGTYVIGPAGLDPLDMAVVNNLLYFTSLAPDRGLWRTDGTAAGTSLVKAFPSSGVGFTVNVNGTLFFLANDGIHGIAPWKSDGTPQGTTMIKAINPAMTTYNSNSAASSAVSYNGLYFFMADDGVHGQELWSSDGTPAGTSMVADINPGPGSGFDVDPYLTIAGGKLIFTANDGIHGRNIWRLNYAPAATDQAYSVNHDNPLVVSGPGVLQGASDRDNDPLTAMLITQPTHGQLTLNLDGSFSYVPQPGFQGTDTFTYTALDPFTFGNLATATINVTSVLAPTHFRVAAPATAIPGTSVRFTVTAIDQNNIPTSAYNGTVHFSSSDPSATLPADATLTNGTGIFNAALNATGAQTISASDTVNPGVTGASNIITLTPKAAQLAVNAPTTATAGSPILVTVTAQDGAGHTATGYTGAVHITSSGGSPLLPADGTLINGVGSFVVTLASTGTFTINAQDTADSALSGASGSIAVSSGAARYFTVVAPTSATTGTSINVTVTALDQLGNTATGYTGKVRFSSSDSSAGLPADTTLTGGTATFSITLKTAGNQTIIATDAVAAVPIITGTSAAITTRGLVVSTFTPNPTGFTATFSKPFVPGDVALWGGTVTSPIQNVTLVGTNSGPVPGTLIIDPSNSSATFKASSTFLQTFFQESVLPNDTWNATLASGTGTGATANGFFDALGAPLDGADNAGHANYTASFTTAYGGLPALSIPDFARGPDHFSTIKVPNDSDKGIPVTLSNAAAVKDVVFALSYNPTLFIPTGAGTGDSSGTGSTFAMGSITSVDATHAKVTFTWRNSTAQNGTVVLGDILANVPDSAANLYKGKELLAIDGTSITVNGAAFAGVWASAVHVNAYLGDVTGDGKISALDVATAGTVAQGNPTAPIGLSAYKLVDPAIIGDTAGDASIDATAVSDLAAFTSNLNPQQVPPPPTGLTITPGGPDPTLSLGEPEGGVGRIGNPSYSGIVSVPVLLDHPRPDGSTGMTEAVLALTYDPKVLTVSSSDITLGTIPALGSGWRLVSVVDQVTGQIGIDLYSTTAITEAQAGSLVNIAFHIVPEAHVPRAAVQLVSAVAPQGHWFSMEIADGEGQFVLSPWMDRLVIRTDRKPR